MSDADGTAPDGGAYGDGAAADRGTSPGRAESWIEGFPWFGGFVAGAAAFPVAYVVLAVVILATPLALPGEGRELFVRIGFLLYNAHNVLVTGTSAAPDVASIPIDYMQIASIPLLYRLYPGAVLTVAAGVFTYWRDPQSRSLAAAAATGAAVATGYVLVALAGTYAFSLEQGRTLYQPARGQTVLFTLLYGLAFGYLGSLFTQAILVRE